MQETRLKGEHETNGESIFIHGEAWNEETRSKWYAVSRIEIKITILMKSFATLKKIRSNRYLIFLPDISSSISFNIVYKGRRNRIFPSSPYIAYN